MQQIHRAGAGHEVCSCGPDQGRAGALFCAPARRAPGTGPAGSPGSSRTARWFPAQRSQRSRPGTILRSRLDAGVAGLVPPRPLPCSARRRRSELCRRSRPAQARSMRAVRRRSRSTSAPCLVQRRRRSPARRPRAATAAGHRDPPPTVDGTLPARSGASGWSRARVAVAAHPVPDGTSTVSPAAPASASARSASAAW